MTVEAADDEAQTLDAVGQDPLTGLPNHSLFTRLLESEIERVRRTVNEHGAAILRLNCDRFQEINDTFGREAGDKVMCALAHRLGNLLRASGRLARLDADDFGIVQTDVVGPRDVEMLARRIIDALAEPFEIDDRKVYVGLSIGIALCPQDADSAAELLRRADVALYRAKNEGRNRYAFFEQKVGDQLRMRKVVEDDLRTAIETGWVRSRKTIVIADSVSLLSALVLFVLAIGAVKGFAFTLGLTTLIDLAVVFFFTKPMMTLLGRTKFFGEGHKFSGFEAEHMGASTAPLHNSLRKRGKPVGGEA